MTPRIDPLKLLTCLKVLLAPNGGINSENEVKRLAGLMAKYSKKLVSKCIYIQILKCTKTDLLGAFMGSGGWSLTHMWLSDGIRTLNWPLVQEILELLLLCPVDIQRLRSNSAPKLVKGLSKDGGNEGVRILASKLVEQWLKVVKGETTSIATVTLPNVAAAGTDIKSNSTSDQNKSHLAAFGLDNTNISLNATQSMHGNSLTTSDQDPLALTSSLSSTDPIILQSPTVAERGTGDSALVYKFILKDGKQVLAKIDSGSTAERKSSTEISSEERTSSPHAINQDEKDEDSKTSSEGSKSDKSSVNNEKDKNKETESKIKDTKDKDKEKSRSSKDKDKHRDHKSSSSSHKSSSSSKSSSSKSGSSSSASKSKSSSSSSSSRKLSTDSKNKDKDRDSEKDKSKSDKEKHKSSSSKSSSSSSSSSSSGKDKHRDRERDRSSKDKDKERDKEKEKDKSKDKEKEKIKDKDDKSEQSDSEKSVLPSIDKLGKIPKKKDDGSSSPSAAVTSITIPSKKASMSIEIRRDTERPKTVKTYKSQFRSHGLTDEAPPPPSRKGLKKPVSQSIPGTAIFSNISFKRPSPPPQSASSPTSTGSKELEPPAEKKLKIDLNPPPSNPANEKPGAIKLIAPKAKPSTLIESDMFMDALSASALPKKDSKKRKRRGSGSKDKENTAASPPASPVAAKAAPLKFYQDTLEDKDEDKSDNIDETKDEDEKKEDEDDIPLKRVKEQIEEEVRQEKEGGSGKNKDDDNEEENDEPVVKKPPGPGCGPDGPPGVLMFHRRKGPKKKLTWKSEEELESIRYFELDETERVNVTKTFNEMKNMDRFNEREAFLLARKLNCEDIMTEQTHWMPLILVDDVPPHPEGSQSKEKKIQAEREQTTLKALYFNRHMIPDSPSEPDMEQYQITEPAVIPLDDITGNPDAVNDFTNMPWPDPKGSPPHNVPDDFLGGPDMGFPPGQFNPFMQFGQPGWQMGPGNGPQGPPNGGMPPSLMGGPPMGPPPMSGPNMGPPMGGFNNMNMGPGPQNMGGPPPAPPSLLLGPPEPDDIGLMKSMNMIPPFGGPNFIGPGPNQGFNNFGPPNMPNMPNMGPNPNMNMTRNMDNGINNRNHNNNNRGNWRSGSAGPPPRDPGLGSWRPQGPSNNRNWTHGNANNRICKAFQRGFCRNGNKCNYMHPANNY